MAAVGNWQAAIENIWKVHCNSITNHFKDLRSETDKVQFVNKMKYIRYAAYQSLYENISSNFFSICSSR